MAKLQIEKIVQLATGPYLRRLRRRLLLMIAIAVVPVLAVILYQAKVHRDVQILEVHEAAWRLTNVIALRQSQVVDAAKQLLILLAQVPVIARGDQGACGEVVRGFLAQNRAYLDIGVFEPAGAMRCRARDSGSVNTLARSSLLRRVLATKDFVIGDHHVLGNWRRRTLTFAYPILDENGAVRDVLFAALDMKQIDQLTAESNLPAGMALTILDSNGTILTRVPDHEEWAGRQLPDAPLLELMQLRHQTTKEIAGLDGITRLYAFKTVGDSRERGQLHVIVGVPKAIAYREADQTLLWNLFGIAMLTGIASGVAWLVGSRSVVEYLKNRGDIEDARARLGAIVESSEDGIVGMTLDGAITTWNSGAEQMYGYDAASIIGQNIAVLTPLEHRDEIPELMQIVSLGKGINRYESERICKDGRRIAVSASLSPIRDSQGSIRGAATITRDITLLRKGEEQMAIHNRQLETLQTVAQEITESLSLAETMPQTLETLVALVPCDHAIVYLIGADGAVNSFSASRGAGDKALHGRLADDMAAAATQCTGEWFVEDVTTVPELAALWPQYGVRATAILPMTRKDRGRTTLVVLDSSAHSFGVDDTQFLKALARQIALGVENGQLYKSSLTLIDNLAGEIEERKKAEKQLADFNAMVVHDLRSPLANIVSMAESVKEGLFGDVNELQRNWLGKIENNCRGLIDQVSDFLDFSRIDAGKLVLKRERASIGSQIHEILAQHSIEAKKRDITLTARIDERLPVLWADSRRVGQVLTNLMSNALKFTDNGGAVEVSAWPSDTAIVVSVRDTGVGIAADDLGDIFQMYGQAASSDKSQRHSTGIGLVICKKIIEAHGGRIWVESEVGSGSSFYFSLPAQGEKVE
ncbi:MAG TPA: ATP-binding protein [Candidatus Deferrimicrobium sp.]|nr:ATP-binding protein [Candidatus Deferrimicrobium sp.]